MINKNNAVGRFVRLDKTIVSRNVFTRGSSASAAIDIAASESCVVEAHKSKLISTGLAISVPYGHAGLLWSRSGLSVKYGIEVGAGCIDEDYTGEVKVILYNHSDKDFQVLRGDRIAQLLTVPINPTNYFEARSLTKTERNTSGFGSTGIHDTLADRGRD